MRTWNSAMVSAPRSRNMPAIDAKLNAMSSACAVMRRSTTTATPAPITPDARSAKKSGSRKSTVLGGHADVAHRDGLAGARAEPQEPAPLRERQADDERRDEQPVHERERQPR